MSEPVISRPQSGPGSIAGFGPRLLAFIVDGILADVIAIVINSGYHAGPRQNLTVFIAFLLIEIVFVTVAGQTPGMRVAGIAVVRFDGQGRAKIGWVLARTVLLAVIVPAVIPDSSGRFLHDRAAGTIMLHSRGAPRS